MAHIEITKEENDSQISTSISYRYNDRGYLYLWRL